MEDGYVQTLCAYHAQATVGVAKHKHSVGLGGSKELVGAVDDVAACCAKVIAYGVHIDLRFCELEFAEEDAVEVVVVVLACMGENHVEVLTALVDDCGKTDNLGACTDDDAKLQFAILLPLYIGIICFHFLIYLRGQNRYLGDWG